MSGLPKGWVEATLDELVTSKGLVTDGDWVESKDQDPNGDVRLTQLADVGDGEFRNRSDRYLSLQSAEKLGCTFLEAGDVLIARMPDPLGRACIFPALPQPAVTVVDVLVFRSGTDLVSPHWIMSAINAPETRQEINAQASGTTRQRISGGNLKRLQLPLPPLAEQKRIVAKLDALNAKSARARTELSRIETLVSRYKHAVLEKAFTGELTREWRRLLLGETLRQAKVGLVRSKEQQFASGGAPYVRMNHFDLEGRWHLDEITHVEASAEELRQYALQPGDVLFNTRNSFELVGKVAYWEGSPDTFLYNNNILRMRFDETINAKFALYQMQSAPFRAYLETVKSATTSVCAIYQKALVQAPLLAPNSLTEQHEIVHRIESVFAKIDRLAVEAKRALALVGKLDGAILAKAFRGELVPQDESDEPAEHLLARIRAEREAAPKARRRRMAEG